ncbi:MULTISPECIES: TetR/AcrR family transcriptional regulator [Klebsiella]|uniref:TetR/AcrR family transcriptional regulator n=1 Tax=Klebsiella aerogenes TaxID=548 RepID=UPI000F7E5744|nr:TetR/AcrR family transcriptional regulator [Klebsiella aerogenes]RSV84523.1 TetR/AcrR family transcriptional regulator [Klebsiella aerogenes]HDU3466537.1 TetR/AcrR family transcriptional regulator [Klebsiella aerogenes]
MKSFICSTADRPLPGRPRVFDEANFLDGAITLFRRHGFSGVSISDITAETGLTTGSIYKAYKDKKGIYVKALQRYVLLREESLKVRLEKASDGREKIAVLLKDYAEFSQGRDGKLGCMVVSGITNIDHLGTVADILKTQLLKRRSALEDLIEQGKQDGSIATTTNVTAAAEIILALLQGMRVTGKISVLTGNIDDFIAQALKILE